jgi:RNA polymerase sigma factor (sigma-70 family)
MRRQQAGVAGAAGCDDRLPELVARMALRDAAALEAVYDITVGRVYGLAMRVLQDVAAAEEVVSDVYHQAWRSAGTYSRERGSVTGWLLMICRSRALDALRTRDAVASGEARMRDVTSAMADDPQDLLEATQRSSCVHAALAALAPMQRQLIALAFFRGYTHEEIAASSGLPLGSVKSLIRRGLNHLRARTRQHEEMHD